MVISGASVWAFLSGNADPGMVLTPFPEAPSARWRGRKPMVDMMRPWDLEAVLERGREVLDPETVRVLEENLQTIDRAIQEAGDAVMQDPASPVLQRFLAENLRKKMDLLRQAAGAVYANT